ncbi:MAG: lactonase family protein, partial [Planctomycetaceae bacterium]
MNRRLSLLMFVVASLSNAALADEFDVYVGTYTSGESQSEGIYHALFNSERGSLNLIGLAAKAENPSFLAVHPDTKLVYAVNELGGTDGAVQAFRTQPDGSLQLVNRQSSEGGAPCHLVVAPSGRDVLVADYMGGNVAVLPIANDGSLKAATSIVQHRGSGVNLQRQKEPHAHSINLSSDGRFAFAADLGADRVFQYRFDAKQGVLTENEPPAVTV